MKLQRALGVFFCLVAMAAEPSFARDGTPPVLNPKTYVSASGVYSLAVDPTDIYGRGPADYRLIKEGKTVWEKRLPYTFGQASVADSGNVAGYAYTNGAEGFSEKGTDAGPGELIVALLSSEGKTLNEERHQREWSRYLHSSPDPLVSGTILDTSNKRFILRVDDPDVNRRMEAWWLFDLESGKRIGAVEPGRSMPEKKSEDTLFILGSQAVPGTSLVLTHWWNYSMGKCSGIFALIDLDDAKAKLIWNLKLDGDYSLPENSEEEDALRERIWKEGAILDVNKSPGFALHAVKQHQRLVFSLEKSGKGEWKVRETARTPYEPPVSKPAQGASTFPQIQLEEAAAVRLGDAKVGKESPIRALWGFGFNAEGKICALSVRENADPHLLQLDKQGKILHDLRLPVGTLPKRMGFSNPANVGGEKYVVTMSDEGEEGKARCFVADFAAPRVEELPAFHSFAITALAGFPDGRFAALVYHRMKYTAGHGLILFDAEGNTLWQKEEVGYAGKPESLLSPEDITRYGEDSIAVLDNIRHTVQFFDTKGVFRRSIALDDAWESKPNYPTYLVEDFKAGLVVYDFNAKFPLVRINAAGHIQSRSVPRFSDGRAIKVVSGIRRSPDGRLWMTDGDVLLRLSDDGMVDRILGEEAVPATLNQLSRAFVDSNGRIYLGDGRTNAIHVFDSAGKKEGVCVPDPTDLTETSYVQHVTGSADGDLYVLLSQDNQAYIRFDKNLKRVGKVRIDLDSVSQEWNFPPSGTLCWVGGYENVYLVQELRKVVRKISRRADGQWLERSCSLGVAPDGSVAILARSEAGAVSVNTYSPAGDPRATYEGPEGWSPFGHVAYDGQTVFFVTITICT